MGICCSTELWLCVSLATVLNRNLEPFLLFVINAECLAAIAA